MPERLKPLITAARTIVAAAFCLIIFAAVSSSQTPAKPDEAAGLDAAKQEIERLRLETERLRKERDSYRKDLDDQAVKNVVQVSGELKLLAAQLSKEIKTDFYDSLTTLLWILGILVGVATVGGYLKISEVITDRIAAKVKEKESDIEKLHDRAMTSLAKINETITERVDLRIREREADFQKLREQVMDSLLQVKYDSAKAIEELALQKQTVAQESDAAISYIRSKRLEVGTASSSLDKGAIIASVAELNAGADATFADLPDQVVGIASCQFGEYGAETLVSNVYRGAFSYYFQKALRDPNADLNNDGTVSLEEAVGMARLELKKGPFPQNPVIAGDGGLSLFSLKPVTESQRPAARILALLVGIVEYAPENQQRLRGAVNDVGEFRKLLENRSYVLAADVVVQFLTNKEATMDAIRMKLDWISDNSTPEDIVLFYYSGTLTVGDGPPGDHSAKIILPHDYDFQNGAYIKIPDLLARLAEINARQRIVVLDG